jgi:hypothetical protein
MLSQDDLALARELLEKVREVTKPRVSPFVRPGELGAPDLLDCSRTTSWKHVKDPTFPRPLVMGPRRYLYRREEVIAWRDAHRAGVGPEKKSPEPAGARSGASFQTAFGTAAHSSTAKSIHDHATAKPKRKQASRRR